MGQERFLEAFWHDGVFGVYVICKWGEDNAGFINQVALRVVLV